ncbi:LPS translocon maturation chaperone LptM [Motilimonas eburnea]|uniref:LPS translocon maturation chaperone LptM n=1 Tax=Motilimonas eburnea TaxID=1737488 RepID=UPI001E390960|nr:lipoprotein [Motilimonas eburnea]MCE2573086.1 lipoprotein [Motilimonas eburnea]
MSRANQIALSIGLVLLLAGCGVKGPLYLPTPEPQPESVPEPTPMPTAELTNNNEIEQSN